MLDQLFPVYFIEPRYPDKLALGIHQTIAQVFVFAAHGFQHVLGTRSDRVGQAEKGRRLGAAVAIDSCASTSASAATSTRGSSILLLVGSELLCKSQR